MLVHLSKILEKAHKGGYALGAFNTINLEMTQGIIRGARNQEAPIVIQISETTIRYAGLQTITQIVQSVVEREGGEIPVVLHLDHGRSIQSIRESIQAGFSSVMIDASDLNLEENIALTRQVVALAHKEGVIVQGELGRVGGLHGDRAAKQHPVIIYTDPAEAREYVRRTKVDTLAVSVGTSHGLYNGKLNFDLLSAIRQRVDVPLVLHGASGESEAQLRQAVATGVSYINIDTELRIAFTEALARSILEHQEVLDPRTILAPATAAVEQKVMEKIKIFGSAHQGI